MKFNIIVGEGKDKGRVRNYNEDYVLTTKIRCPASKIKDELPYQIICVVADGVGGLTKGEQASQLAANYFATEYSLACKNGGSTKDNMNYAIHSANNQIIQRGSTSMGTTLVAAVIEDDKATIANIGDSRAYLIRGYSIKQITSDHSWVADQVQKGYLTEVEAKTHPRRNVITRLLGTKQDIKIDYFEEKLQLNDIIVLCSDGLYEHANNSDIRDIAISNHPANAVNELINLANERGGSDNISVALIKVQEYDSSGAFETIEDEKVKKTNQLGMAIITIFAIMGLLGLFGSSSSNISLPSFLGDSQKKNIKSLEIPSEIKNTEIKILPLSRNNQFILISNAKDSDGDATIYTNTNGGKFQVVIDIQVKNVIKTLIDKKRNKVLLLSKDGNLSIFDQDNLQKEKKIQISNEDIKNVETGILDNENLYIIPERKLKQARNAAYIQPIKYTYNSSVPSKPTKLSNINIKNINLKVKDAVIFSKYKFIWLYILFSDNKIRGYKSPNSVEPEFEYDIEIPTNSYKITQILKFKDDRSNDYLGFVGSRNSNQKSLYIYRINTDGSVVKNKNKIAFTQYLWDGKKFITDNKKKGKDINYICINDNGSVYVLDKSSTEIKSFDLKL